MINTHLNRVALIAALVLFSSCQGESGSTAEASQACAPTSCVAEGLFCQGDLLVQCARTSSGCFWTSSQVDCAAEGLVCAGSGCHESGTTGLDMGASDLALPGGDDASGGDFEGQPDLSEGDDGGVAADQGVDALADMAPPGGARSCDDPSLIGAAGHWFVAADGSDAAAGDVGAPFATLARAIDSVSPGEMVHLRGGEYAIDDQLVIKLKGEASAPIVIEGCAGEEVTLDFSTQDGEGDLSEQAGVRVREAAYLTLRRFKVRRAAGSGVLIHEDSHHITVEQVDSAYNGRHAVYWGHGFIMSSGASDILLWRCDAHHNGNAKGEKWDHGDGFYSSGPGEGRVLRECRTYHNGDDGVDMYLAQSPLLIEDSWAFSNGLDDEAGSLSGRPNRELGNGDGFKLGGNDPDRGTLPLDHIIRRSVSWSNGRSGFNENRNQGSITIEQCTAYDNGFETERGHGFEAGFFERDMVRNNVAHANYKRYYFPNDGPNQGIDSVTNSWDLDVALQDDDFLSLDDTIARGPRGPEGQLPVSDFLRPAPGGALIDAGTAQGNQPYSGQAPEIGAYEYVP